MNILQRLKSPTPKFWQKIGALGIAFIALGTTMVAPPMAGVVLPAAIPQLGGYLIFGGTLLKSVSTMGVHEEPDNKDLKPLCITLLFLVLSFSSFAQLNQSVKAIASFNTDSATVKTYVSNIQSTYGDVGAIYYNIQSDKWRIAKTVSNVVTWYDLPVPAGSGSVTSVSGTSPIQVSGTTAPIVSILTASGVQAGAVSTAAQTFAGTKTFTPTATVAGINFGSVTAHPSGRQNGDAWYRSDLGQMFVRAGGSDIAIQALVTYTGSNGITKTSNDFRLGGTLTQTTTIDQAGQNFNIADNTGGLVGVTTIGNTSDAYLQTGAGVSEMVAEGEGSVVGLLSSQTLNLGGTFVAINSSSVGTTLDLTASNNVGNGVARILFNLDNVGSDPQGVTFTQTGTYTGGIKYDADYSAGYTSRSLVDKAYADTKISGTMTSGRIPIGLTSNSLTTSSNLTYNTSTNTADIGAAVEIVGGLIWSNSTWTAGITLSAATKTGTGQTVSVLGGSSSSGSGGNVTITSGQRSGSGSDGNIVLDADAGTVGNQGYIILNHIPTSSAGLPSGAIWSNAGVLTIVP